MKDGRSGQNGLSGQQKKGTMNRAMLNRVGRLRGFLKGKRLLSELERLCIERQIEDLYNGHKRGLVWDEAEVQRTIALFGLLKHWKKPFAGKPFIPAPWQEECIIAPVFGWKKKDGNRRFSISLNVVPRKIGKTTLAACVAIKGLVGDQEDGAEVYTVATKKDQARICFKDVVKMIKRSPEIAELVEVFKTSVEFPQLDAVLSPLSADSNTMDGLNTHLAIVDELHKHPTRDVWDVILTSTSTRLQALIFAISTAGTDMFGICRQQYEYAENVLKQIFEDDSFHAYIACAEEKDDIENRAVWWKANPNLGISKRWEYMEEQCLKAVQDPLSENTFRNRDLNQWTAQETRYIPMDKYDACDCVINRKALEGRLCYGGLDLSTRIDLTAFVLVFPPSREGEQWKVLFFFFIPEVGMEQRIKRDKVPYDLWVRQGWVEKTPGNAVDYRFVMRRIVEEKRKYDFKEIGLDPFNAAGITNDLEEEGFEPIEIRQGYSKLSAPTKDLLALILDGAITHGKNPVARWNADAVTVKQNTDGEVRPVKPDRMKSSKRIDGTVGQLMALDRARRNESRKKKSVYSKRRGLVGV